MMYLKHFAFTHFPFDQPLAPESLFESTMLAEARIRLQHLIELRGIGLLTGEPGSGKTTLTRHVAAALHPGLYRLVYVALSTGNVMDMYKSIAWELGLPTERNRAAAFRQIRTEVSRLLLEGKQRPVVVIDEAHHLRNEVLEDLRLLTNYEMDSENRLCLLFVGLTELRRRLRMAVHESLDQRIVVRYHLGGMTRAELPEYLTHRLRAACCELPLFEPAAIEAIFQATQALPRKVNRLAHYALASAAIAKKRTVTDEHVQAALQELGS
jgi:type II secretory pathway predicted ATPase ExeA